MSYAAAALKVSQDERGINAVEIDGLVALKVVQHCKQAAPTLVTGQLLGLDVGQTLEVTNCFPFPHRSASDEDGNEGGAADDGGASYQLEMMRCLRMVNVDNNTVGWYQSTYMGSYHTVELIETFLNYQENIKNCVCIIYDPTRTLHEGTLDIKAIKLNEAFVAAYHAGDFSIEKLKEKGVKWDEIFTELPVSMRNPAMATALMTELESDAPATQDDFDRLDMSATPFLEKNIEFLAECMDDLSMEQYKQISHSRNLAKQQMQQQAWLDKRRAENAKRRDAGEDLLPEEDPMNPIFKPISEPSRLDSLLINNSIATYSGAIDSFAAQCFPKMELMNALASST